MFISSWKFSLAKYDGVCECNVGYEQFVRVARKRNREVLWQFLENWCPDIRRCEVNGAFYNEGSHEDLSMCQNVQCSCPKRPSGTKSGHWVYVKGCRYVAQEIEGCQRKWSLWKIQLSNKSQNLSGSRQSTFHTGARFQSVSNKTCLS